MDFGGYHRRGRIRPHAAGVGALVVVEQALVILTGGQRHDVAAVAHHHEAGFFALQKLFDHHAGFAVVLNTQGVAAQHVIHSGMGFFQRLCHHHAFACGQTVGLDHDRRADLVDIGMGGSRIVEGVECSGGNAVTLHEGFAERLGAFQLGSSLCGAKNAQARSPKDIHHARGQRRFGAHHGEIHFFCQRPLAQLFRIGDGQILQHRFSGRAAIARRYIHPAGFFRLRQLPCQGVFAPA